MGVILICGVVTLASISYLNDNEFSLLLTYSILLTIALIVIAETILSLVY